MKKEKYSITEEKKFELIEEFKTLNEVTLKEIADRLEDARKNDISEDDIQLGEILEEKEIAERRINEISDILDNCKIIEDKESCEPFNVDLGSSVKLKQGHKVFDVKIVSSIKQS
jgi:transcription elongation GreA/GreB family factor